ncbi:MAG TPA: hypothetical protein VEG60_02305, partial [Candidatus Binatia bacterium]|nr:hypothetical protein [Candidatus Binatia bacterium]
MTEFEIGRPKRKRSVLKSILVVVVVAAVVAGAYVGFPKFEWHKPQVTIVPDTDTIGLAPLEIEVNERGTGLESVAVTLSVGGTEQSLFAERYDPPVTQTKVTIISSKLTGIKEGPAVFRVSARDRSWWNFFRGNQTVIERNVNIDITPPTLELVADDAYVNFGGCGLVVYKTSADAVKSGVKIG